MKILKAVTAGLMLAATPLLAQAEGMSYSYLDLGYVETDIDGVGPTADGFGVRGSVGVAKNFFVFADYSDQEVANIDVEQIAAGLGGHYGLSDNLDLVGRVGWAKAKVSGFGGAVDDDGYLVAAGLRSRLGENVELEGSVIHTDFGGGSDDTALAVGGRYYFSKTFAVGAEYQTSDDVSSIMAGVRVSF
ncbi:MAG TPA: porin [Steroidobacteraceae bacterium]|nr:porin [Steroidobacteraceae bacterium]